MRKDMCPSFSDLSATNRSKRGVLVERLPYSLLGEGGIYNLSLSSLSGCPAGTWGGNCTRSCNCGDDGNNCNHVNGECVCNKCWSGTQCLDGEATVPCVSTLKWIICYVHRCWR